MKDDWGRFEHWLLNQWPHNPTQTAYFRFNKNQFELPPSRFDEAMKSIFKTPYLDRLEKEQWRE